MWRKPVSVAVLLLATTAWASKGLPQINPFSQASTSHQATLQAVSPSASPVVIHQGDLLSAVHQPGDPMKMAGGNGAHLFQNEDTLRFDDPATVDNNAIGLSGGGTYQAAIHLTTDELGAFGGYGIASVVFYHHEAGTHEGRVIIYGPGSLPADTLATEAYTVTGPGWFRVDLTTPVTIDGSADLWVSVEVTHAAGEYPIGVDAGPAVDGKGDWVYAEGLPWDELQNFGLDYNWDIMALVSGGGGGPAHDVATTAILAPSGFLFLNDVVTPQVKVRNFGSNTETFDVTFKIFDASLNEVYSDVQTVTDLDPGATETVSFTDYTATATGTFITLAYVSLAGDENPGNDSASGDFQVLEGQLDYVIIDLDPTTLTGPMLHTTLSNLGLSGVYTTDANEFNNLALYKSLWLLCGIYSNNTQITPEQGAQIETFLMNGGTFYLEGGDVWGYDPGTGAWDPGPWTGVTGADDGSADLANVLGLANSLIPGVEGYTWAYTGENNWIDQLTVGPVQGGTAEGIFQNADVGYTCGVAYDQGTFKSVGVSFELGGLSGDMSFDSLVLLIADFFDLITDVAESSPVLQPVQLQVNNPVRRVAQIAFTLPTAGHASLEVYDLSGRRVATLVNGHLAAGQHTVQWSAHHTGVYFVKLATPSGNQIHKLVVLR